MANQTGTSNFGWQNKFVTTLSSGITASTTTIPLNGLPNPSEGLLIIEPDSSTAWEVIYYTSKTGSAVVCPSAAAGRGQDDSTAQSHSQGATVRMDSAAGMFEVLQNLSSTSTNAITGDKLATNAISLGRALNTSTAVVTAGAGDQTLATLTVTVPAGGRDIELMAYIPNITDGGAAVGTLKIWKTTVGGTLLNSNQQKWQGSDQHNAVCLAFDTAVSAGTVVYLMSFAAVTANLQYNVGATTPAFISAKLI